MALCDRPGLVDADEEERDAPVADLFDAGAKYVGQAFKVVADLLRSGQEDAVGQKRGPGEVVRKADLGDVAGLCGGKPCEVEGCFQKLILRQKP